MNKKAPSRAAGHPGHIAMGGDRQELRPKAGWVLTELKHGVTTKVAQEMSGKQGVLFLQALTRTPTHTHRHTNTHKGAHRHTCTGIHVHTHSRTHTDTHTQTHTCTKRCARRHAHPYSR